MLLFYTISFWVLISSIGKPESILKNKYISKLEMLMFTILITSLIPLRQLSYYGEDMSGYIASFQNMHKLSLIQTFGSAIWEPLFVFMQWLISRFTNNGTIYLIVTVILYIAIFYKGLKKIFVPWQYIFVFFAYLNFSFFYGYVFNGSRQGFSMMFLFLALSYWISSNSKYKVYIAGLSAILCHYSSLPLVITIFILQKFNTKLKYIMSLWILSAILFLTGINHYLNTIPFLSKIHLYETYSSSASLDYFGGQTNNIKFLIFSAFFLFLFLFLYKKIKLEDAIKNNYLNLIKCYIVFNIYFLLFGFIAFSNRIASYSWFIIPILVLYPVLHKKKHSPLLLFIVTVAILLIGLFTSMNFYRGIS